MSELLGKPLTEGQYKLVAHPLRIRILHALTSQELTAAQVADTLGETRGNVHYHMQKLYAGGLLELTHTTPHGGILERYYHAATTRFRVPSPPDDQLGRIRRVITWLERTSVEAETLLETLEALLGAWERVGSRDNGESQTWKVTVQFEPVVPVADEVP